MLRLSGLMVSSATAVEIVSSEALSSAVWVTEYGRERGSWEGATLGVPYSTCEFFRIAMLGSDPSTTQRNPDRWLCLAASPVMTSAGHQAELRQRMLRARSERSRIDHDRSEIRRCSTPKLAAAARPNPNVDGEKTWPAPTRTASLPATMPGWRFRDSRFNRSTSGARMLQPDVFNSVCGNGGHKSSVMAERC